MPRLSVIDRRSQLLDSALRVVAREGVAGATTRAIVAEAGMSLASFHYAFRSRDELLAELVSTVVAGEATVLESLDVDRGERAGAALGAGAADGGERAGAAHGATMADTVRRGLLHYFDLLRSDPPREQAMLELTQYALRSPELQPLARAQYQRYYALAEAALDVAARSTGLVWTRPAAEIAATLVVLTDGLTIGWLANRDDAAALAVIDFAAQSLAALAEAA